jgi:hypothetical protein
MKRIVYAENGGVVVVTPVINTHTLVDGEVVPVSESIPQDRTFRNAWTMEVRQEGAGGKIDATIMVDMTKARELHRATLRGLRAPKLAALDIDYQRADEADDKTAKQVIAAKKQALRDVTDDPAIEAAKTPEELKAVLPEALK